MQTYAPESISQNRERHERMRDGLTIGRLAALTGVSAKAIRYYEEIGLLPRPPRGANRYRRYGPADVNRVRLLRRSATAGRAAFPGAATAVRGGRCALRGRPDGGAFARARAIARH